VSASEGKREGGKGGGYVTASTIDGDAVYLRPPADMSGRRTRQAQHEKRASEDWAGNGQGPMKARDVVDYIRERMASKESQLRTKFLPYDIVMAV